MKQSTKIILASGSPRRRMLFESLGIKFEAISPDADESFNEGLTPEEIATGISIRKADAVAEKYFDCAVIAADTIVVSDGMVLGKPNDRSHAYEMLNRLSGKWHNVITGICIIYNNEKTVFSEMTRVHFRQLGDEFINWYISTQEPMDKAGAYGIQGYGSVIVDKIEGDFYNVMGFPISKIMGELDRLNIYNIGRG